jgi:hypothetical protein
MKHLNIYKHDKKTGRYELYKKGRAFHSDWSNTFSAKKEDIDDLSLNGMPYNIKFELTDLDMRIQPLSNNSALVTLSNSKTVRVLLPYQKELLFTEEYLSLGFTTKTCELSVQGRSIGEIIGNAQQLVDQMIKKVASFRSPRKVA